MKDEVIKRITKTLELFIENKGEISDEQLASLLSLEGIKTSSSTVGRDLTINLRKMFINNSISNELSEKELEKKLNIINFVAQKRTENKNKGQVKGGVNSVFNNDILKDENGKFRGSVKRRG